MRTMVLALALLLVPMATAGTADDPDVQDPAGDAGVNGVPAPAFSSWDVVAAWIEPVDNETFLVSIVVADAPVPPASGEVGVTFRVGEQHFIAGYVVVPGIYSGGFVSKSDENGDVPASESPQSVEATFANGVASVKVPIEILSPDGPLVLHDPWAWSEYTSANGEEERLDRTDVGRTVSLAPAGSPTPAPPTDADAPPGRAVPASALASVLAILAGVALLRRR